MSHTPGPWQRSGVRQKLGDEDCIRVGPDGFAIAFLPIGRRPQEQAGAIADATLIAAAPDLLDALQKSADTFKDLAFGLRMLGKLTMAEACALAEAATRSTIANATKQA